MPPKKLQIANKAHCLVEFHIFKEGFLLNSNFWGVTNGYLSVFAHHFLGAYSSLLLSVKYLGTWYSNTCISFCFV